MTPLVCRYAGCVTSFEHCRFLVIIAHDVALTIGSGSKEGANEFSFLAGDAAAWSDYSSRTVSLLSVLSVCCIVYCG